MARNTGEGYRVGAVKERVQVQNPATGHYVKIDITTGKIIDMQKERFKGVRLKKTALKVNPAVKKSTALKAERAIIAFSKRVKNKV